MPTIELFVSLKVPDNVAITAFNTLKKIGYDELIALERSDCYKFDIKNNINEFKKEISNTDILVNANKHKCNFELNNNNKTNIKNKKNNNFKKINVLVQDSDNGTALLSTLRERLGFKNIKKIEKGVLWAMYFDKNADAEKIAGDIAKNLLMNENYQKFRVLK